MVTLKRTNSGDKDFRTLVAELDRELWEIYSELMNDYSPHNEIENNDTVVIAYEQGRAVGCGCFKKFDDRSVEVKRMYVQRDYRSRGVARQILEELESWAKGLGQQYIVLETGRRLHAAIYLYQKTGYSISEPYEPYVGMSESICMRKTLI